MNLFRKHSLFSTLLNLVGMSLAIAAFIVMLIQVRYDWGFDKWLPEHENIYRFEYNSLNGTTAYNSQICRPFIEMLRGKMTGVKSVGTYDYGSTVRSDFYTDEDLENGFNLPIASADTGMINVLNLKLIEGRTEDFQKASSILLSENTARKIFGNESAVGKHLRTSPEGPAGTVVGVYPTPPENCSVPDGVILRMSDEQIDYWPEWSYMLFLRFEKGAVYEDVMEQLRGMFLELLGDEDESFDSEAFLKALRLTKLHDVYYMTDVESDSMAKGNRGTTNTLFAVSLLVIIIALINFVNFTTASVPFFIKSINTRRVLGSSRASLIFRSLCDSAFIAVLAFACAVLIIHLLSGSFLANYVSGSLAVGDNLGTFAIGMAITIACAVLAGLYPAFYSTSFQPALVLKGSFSLSAQGRALRNILVGVQYVASFTLAAFALFIFVQTNYMKHLDMGFNSDQVVCAYVGPQIGGNTEGFKQRLMENPDIQQVSFTGGWLVSRSKMGWGRSFGEHYVQMDVLPCTPDFLDLLGLKVIEGRNFVETDNQSIGGTFILNETAATTYPYLTVGTRFQGHNYEVPAEIVGIVKDFNFKPLQYSISPFAFYVFGSEPWWPLTHCFIKISPQNVSETFDWIYETMHEFDEDWTKDTAYVFFLDEENRRFYQKEENLNRLITFAAALSFIIALIGILGLVYFETQFKRKETAVRKVYGASSRDILRSMNLRYLGLAGISFVVAVPLSIYIMKSWVQSFSYQAPIPVWIFIASLMAGVLVTVVTVTLRTLSAANANPVESLKNE